MAIFTNYIAPNSAYYLTLNIIEKIPDDYVTSNKTKVDVIGTITGVKSAYSSSYSSSTNTVNVNGRLFYPNTAYSVSNGRTAEIFRYNDIEIEHEADGSKKINVSWSFNGNTSGSYNPNGSVSGEVTLTTIPRATKILEQTGTIGKDLTITWTKASDTFRHKLTYSLGEIKNQVLGDSLVDSYTWMIPEDLYKQFTDTPNKSGTLYLTTYKGDTQIGDTQSAKITINADKVEAEPLIAEDIILTDINDATTSLTKGNRFVLGQSRLNIILDVATRKYATLKSLTINGQSIDTTLLTAGPQTSDGTTYYSLDYDGFGVLDSESITFTATDTRDFPTTYVLEIPDSNIIKYIPLDAVVNFKRIAPTSGEVGVEFSGNYFNGSFGNTNNSLTISYKYKKSTATTYSTDITLQNNTDYKISGNTYFSGTGTSKQRIKLAPSFDYKSQYDLQLTIKDKLTTLPTINVIITKGIPIFWWNGEKVTINGDLYIADTDGNNPVNVKNLTSGGYDSLPVGSIVKYDGDTVPFGYEEVPDPDDYSTQEKVIGTYEDGKPIYQKTFTGTYNNGATLLSNVDKMLRVEGQVRISDMLRLIPYFELYNSKNYIGTVQNYQNKITTRFEEASVGKSAYMDVTIRWTKTTD